MATALPFRDRRDAGHRLAAMLQHLRGDDVVVLGLARGGMAVAAEVAHELKAPLDVLVVRKIGAPGNPEFAVGAIAPGARVMDDRVIQMLGVPEPILSLAVEHAATELRDREQRYFARRRPISLAGKTVILVDDGLATGSTAAAAVASVRHQQPRRVIVAVPVGSVEAVAHLQSLADEVVCMAVPSHFSAVGQWYQQFEQLTDGDVLALLEAATLY